MDLLDLYRRVDGRQKLSWRKLAVYVDHLPPESATITAIRASLTEEELAERIRNSDPSKGTWSPLEMLMAALIDEVRDFEHLYVSAHVKKGEAGKPPDPIPRPGVAKGGRKQFKSKLTDEQRARLDPRLRVVGDGEAG